VSLLPIGSRSGVQSWSLRSARAARRARRHPPGGGGHRPGAAHPPTRRPPPAPPGPTRQPGAMDARARDGPQERVAGDGRSATAAAGMATSWRTGRRHLKPRQNTRQTSGSQPSARPPDSPSACQTLSSCRSASPAHRTRPAQPKPASCTCACGGRRSGRTLSGAGTGAGTAAGLVVQLAPGVGWLQVCAVCRGTGVGPARHAGLMSGSRQIPPPTGGCSPC
jgi:hypothetical protein